MAINSLLKASVIFLIFYFLITVGLARWGDFSPSLDEVKSNYIAWSWQNRVPVSRTSWPTILKTLFPSSLLLSESWHRLPSLIIGLLDLASLIYLSYIWSRNSTIAFLTALNLCLAPMFIQSSIFDFSGVLILGLSLWGIHFLYSRKWLVGTSCLILCACAALYLDIGGWQFYFKNLPSSSEVKIEVDNRIRTEFRINTRQDIVPIWLKRIVYNKYYWPLRLQLSEWVKIWDFDWWLAPSQIGSTVSRSVWSEKGLPKVMFWQLALALLAVYWRTRLTKISSLFVGFGWFLSSLGSTQALSHTALPLVIPISLLSSTAIYKLTTLSAGRILLIPLSLLVLSGSIANFHHFVAHQFYWRDNRSFVFSQIVTLLSSCAGQNSIATSILGPTQYYYAWVHRTPPATFQNTIDSILFQHFDLSHSPDHIHTCFVGFPGEFLGNRIDRVAGQNDFSPTELPAGLELVNSTSFRDAVSYGNGNHIWAVRKHI